MPALKIPLFKMKDMILILCLLKMSSAVPAFPQQPGIPGMASLSLEYSRFGFGKSFNSLWMNGLLPPHSSFPWMRPREHETQQPSLQPQQPGQKPFLQPTVVTSMQNAVQKGVPQPPIYQGHPPLQQAEGPMVEQQVAPSEKPPTTELPGMDFADLQDPPMFPIAHLISRGPMPQNKPSQYVTIVSLVNGFFQGGRGDPLAYGAIFPGFGGMRPRLGGMPHNPDMGGDFTLEFDSPVAATKGPEKGEGGAQDSPVPEAHLADPESPALLSELAPGALEGLLANPEGNIPNLARGPAGRSRGFLRGVTPAAADPLMTPGLAEVYETYGADETTTLGLQEETTVDSTATPDTQHTLMPRNKAQQPQIKHDAWHFQEP
uniref:Ameloblastin n=1 Tax=Bos taurus TaxID=9913 RepID=A0A3Q1ML82_BOVIN